MNNNITHKKHGVLESVVRFFERAFIVEKLNNWIGYFIFLCIALFFGYVMVFRPAIGISIMALLPAFAVTMVCLFNTEAGFYFNVIYSFFAFHISRLLFYYNIDIPVGSLSDVLILVTFLGLFLKGTNLKPVLNEFTRSGVVRFFLILYCYFAIQLFNPYADSFVGWFYALRKVLATLFLFFTAFNVLTSYASVIKFIKVFFVISFMVALYGCIQEWHGIFEFERYWLYSDPHGVGLAFIGGDFRKFSTMSDPAAFSIAMAVCSVFFTVLATGEKRIIPLYFILPGIIIMVMSMSYSGTRTANAMLVAALSFFALFTFNQRRYKVFIAAGVFILLIAMFGPFNNATLNRFRTTFSASDDPSYIVREVNRKSIQGYIHTHPIGGGLATTGGTGKVYNPGHYLAGFQPDSGYLKKALEIGTIGLGLYCILYFLILKMGIRGYFHCSDKETKLIYAAGTCALFSFFVGDYAQQAMGQITDIVIYYPLIVILIKLKDFQHKPKHFLL